MPRRRRNRLPISIRSATARHSRSGLLHRALQIESLEQRRLLALIVWDGGGEDNNWNTPANWNGNIVPGSEDDAQIGLAFGSETITRDSGIGGIRSLTSEAALNFTGGSLFISDNSTINNALNLSGTASVGLESMTLSGTGTLNNAALLRTAGATNINTAIATTAGSTIRVEANSNVSNSTLTVANGFTNNGTIDLRSSGPSLSALAVTSGTLVNASTGAINTTGDSSVARELRVQLDNQGVVNVSASMMINKDSADHVNSGTINIRDATLVVSQSGTTPTFTNIAGIDIALAAALTINGGAISQVNPGTITGGGTFTLSGTAFTGVGIIAANVINNASLFGPGAGPGFLAIDGNYTQSSTGELLIEIGGVTSATQFDQVIVSGTASLAGTLRVDLIGGFAPNPGDSFLVLDGDTTGNFSTLDLDPLPSGRDWQVGVDPVTLTVVSNPTDILVTKTDSPDPVPAGANLTYIITVRNNSSVDANEVALTDVVPTGTTFVSFAAPAGWNTTLPDVGGGGTVRATRGTLAEASAAEFTLVVQVGAGLSAGTIITNTAQVSTQSSDSNPENNSASILTTVTTPVNRPPVLGVIADQIGDEGTAITFTATASDPDQDDLTFSLDAGAPAGASINASTGAFAWTPTEAQGPGTINVTTRVTDDGSPALSDFQTIIITVGEVNLPPVLAPIADRNAQVGQTETFTATASDPDIPAGDLTFSLDAGAPARAAIDPATGEFSFTPIAAQADQTFSITVRVVDDGDPELSDSETFEITVQPQPQFTVSPVGGPPVAVPGQLRSFSVTFTDPNSAGGYTATVNWGDGITDNGVIRTQTAGGVTSGGVSFWHTYTTVGDRTIRLTLRDSLGNVRSSDLFITVQLVTIQPDYLDPLRRALVVGGFENFDDIITFNPDGGGVNVMYHNYSHGQFTIDGSVVAFSQGGNDTVRVHRSLAKSSMLFGQAGNDFLVGGAGTNVLVGGAGNDTLFGNAARDLLFGGLGMDMLFGIAPDEFNRVDDGDLIASDLTAWEYDPALMASIFHRWNSSNSYADRLQDLRYMQSPTLNSTTVFEDFAPDKLIGGTGLDWFVFFTKDWVMDAQPGEEGLGVPL